MNLVDSHAHLDSPQFKEDLSEILDRARNMGVSSILTVGCLTRNEDIETEILQILDKNTGIYAAFGVHPHDAQFYDDKLENRLLDLLQHPKTVGLGEIGLDFFYDNSPREQQREVFQRQLHLAAETSLPIIIHTRDAESETLEVLENSSDRFTSGVLHCFSGSTNLAKSCIDLGLHIGIGGILTFKKAGKLLDIVKSLPKERLLIETDCPFLAPVPKRGKRNEPGYVRFVAEVVAEIRGITLEETASITSQNFHSLFGLANRLPTL